MKAYCPETKCIYHDIDGCKADVIYHSTDLFCTSYKNKVEPEYKEMMRYSKPIDFKRCEKDVSN